MPRFVKILLAFLAGLVVGEAIPIIWYILATNHFGLHDRDGGGAMGLLVTLADAGSNLPAQYPAVESTQQLLERLIQEGRIVVSHY